MTNGKSICSDHCCHLISKNRNAVISSRIESLTVILNYLEQWTASPKPKNVVKTQELPTARTKNNFFSFYNVCECVFFCHFSAMPARLSPYYWFGLVSNIQRNNLCFVWGFFFSSSSLNKIKTIFSSWNSFFFSSNRKSLEFGRRKWPPLEIITSFERRNGKGLKQMLCCSFSFFVEKLWS